MKVELVEIQETEKSVLRQLLELYAYDFSEFDGADVNEHGYYGYAYLDHYWLEAARHPFFIKVDGQLAGLVLVSDYRYYEEDPASQSISEFFVMRKYRNRGVGKAAAFQTFDRSPGKWEVFQHQEAEPSQKFWEAVIGEYTQGNFRKEMVKKEWGAGQVLIFDNSRATG
jgi:predicted acetyltransferase